MRVKVNVDEDELENDEGQLIDGLRLTCSKCGHQVEVFGTEVASARRGTVMLREKCPRGERNFYVIDDWE